MEETSPSTGQSEQAVYNATSNPDAQNTGVVLIRNWISNQDLCTGVLLDSRTVMTAAHCFAQTGHGCISKSGPGTEVRDNVVLFSQDGANFTETRGIEDVSIAPNAFTFAANDCPAGSLQNCSNVNKNTAIRRGSDMVLLHLEMDAPPGFVRTPIVTSLADNLEVPGKAYTHRMLDSAPEFYTRSTMPRPVASGFGAPRCGPTVRRSGSVQFDFVGPRWHKGCTQAQSCSSLDAMNFPSPCSLSHLNGSTQSQPSWYETDSVTVVPTSSAPGVWDGPIGAEGDSGSPLFLDFPNASGQQRRYVLGIQSSGRTQIACDEPEPTQFVSSEYAAPFTIENGTWIEKTIQYWSSREYAMRSRGWSGFDNLSGGLGSGPSASHQGFDTVDSFMLSSNAHVWRRNWNGSAWSWSGPLSNDLATSPPSSVSWGPNRVDVAVRGQNGDLVHLWTDGGAWYRESLGGGILAGTGPAITSWGVNSLHIFVIGTNGNLQQKEYSLWGGWSDWYDLGYMMAGMTSSPAVVSWAPGRLDVFAQRSDNKVVAIYEERYAAPALGWQYGAFSYFNHNIYPHQGVTATSWAPGHIDVFGRSASNRNNVVHFGRDSQGWQRQSLTAVLSGGAGGTPAATSFGPGRIDLFVQGAAPASNLLHAWFPQ